MDIPWILQEKGKHDWGDKLRIKVSNQKKFTDKRKRSKNCLEEEYKFSGMTWKKNYRKLIKIIVEV